MVVNQKITGKKHLFFDLDHTLWDYQANSNETLTELWESYKLSDFGVDQADFLTQFEVVNTKLWDGFNKGEITKETIRTQRFSKVFETMNIGVVYKVDQLQEDYLNICPTKTHVIADAHLVLEELAPFYNLHIITNGFDEIQSVKLAQSGLTPFFNKIITSSSAGYQKPQPEIFEHSLRLADATAKVSLMIGDNPESDIIGASNAGIDQVFYNPNNLHCSIAPTAEIDRLKSLLTLLL